jgi:hypothetical protein
MAPKKGKKSNESEEERRLRLEMEAMKAEEERREKEARMKAQLKAWQEEHMQGDGIQGHAATQNRAGAAFQKDFHP